MSTPAKRPADLTEPSSFAPLTVMDYYRSKLSLWWKTLAFAFAGFVCISLGDDLHFASASAGSLYLAEKSGEPANHKVANLIVNETTPMPVDQPAPLGMSVENANDLDFLVVFGLPKGTTLSAGFSVGADGWSLYTSEIKDAVIRPPPHFVGVMKPTVSLIAAPGFKMSEDRPLRYEWAVEKVPEKTPPEAEARSRAIHQLSPEETAALLERGNELISSGDLAAARLVLRRAVEAGNARAAFALAGTYDPTTLAKLQVRGLSPDLALAQHWYNKAKELTSRDAFRELPIQTIRRN